MKNIAVAFVGIISLLYLLNFGAGFIELIPDNFPIIGNLDEAGAVALLIASLRYFGFDPLSFFEKKKSGPDVIEV